MPTLKQPKLKSGIKLKPGTKLKNVSLKSKIKFPPIKYKPYTIPQRRLSKAKKTRA